MIVQQVIVHMVVAAAALWLVWSFGPEGLRRAVLRRRRVPPAHDLALQADGLAGEAQAGSAPPAKCAPDCGCG